MIAGELMPPRAGRLANLTAIQHTYIAIESAFKQQSNNGKSASFKKTRVPILKQVRAEIFT